MYSGNGYTYALFCFHVHSIDIKVSSSSSSKLLPGSNSHSAKMLGTAFNIVRVNKLLNILIPSSYNSCLRVLSTAFISSPHIFHILHSPRLLRHPIACKSPIYLSLSRLHGTKLSTGWVLAFVAYIGCFGTFYFSRITSFITKTPF